VPRPTFPGAINCSAACACLLALAMLFARFIAICVRSIACSHKVIVPNNPERHTVKNNRQTKMEWPISQNDS
jgi:hypothetical protein